MASVLRTKRTVGGRFAFLYLGNRLSSTAKRAVNSWSIILLNKNSNDGMSYGRGCYGRLRPLFKGLSP
jgi:hypothetical protein